MSGNKRSGGVRVRRSPHLVAYWRQRTLVACNYATGDRVHVPVWACQLLNYCGDWTGLDELRRKRFVAPATFADVIDRLVSLRLLERSDVPRDPRSEAMDALAPWNPQVGFFHSTTRDVPFAPPRVASRYIAAKIKHAPPPPAVKRYDHVERIDLGRASLHDSFADVLRARRTWRRYSTKPVALDELATLLALTAGVQQWVHADGLKIPLKTSPSGGARHAIECYVVARHVDGLRPGIYYYAPDRHALHRLGARVPVARMRDYVPGSGYFANGSAMVFFTAVFERILWRYPYARAYRAALIESGHVCQTFCLTATRLGLAPFSVMALADSIIEQDLGIDGIRESVLYAAGVGRPPRGTSWAARPTGPNPPTRRNPRV
jgi:SagB-type dehydrogenase family enzyme